MELKGNIILFQIQEKREKMIAIAKKKGFTSEDTIRCSQELDELIYEYQRTFHLVQKQKESIHLPFKKMLFAVHKKLEVTKHELSL